MVPIFTLPTGLSVRRNRIRTVVRERLHSKFHDFSGSSPHWQLASGLGGIKKFLPTSARNFRIPPDSRVSLGRSAAHLTLHANTWQHMAVTSTHNFAGLFTTHSNFICGLYLSFLLRWPRSNKPSGRKGK